MKKHTYREIASDYKLWMEFADPSGHDTEEQFNSKTVEEKIAFLVSCFGPETPDGDRRLWGLEDEEIGTGSALNNLAVKAGYPSARSLLDSNNMWGLSVREFVEFLENQK